MSSEGREQGILLLPQLVSSISEETAYIVGGGAYIYCLNNVPLESTCQWVCGVDRRCPLWKSIARLLHCPCVEPEQHGAGLVLAYVPSPGLQEGLWLFTMEQFPSGCKEEQLDGKAMQHEFTMYVSSLFQAWSV